jgi:hypothetical protein
VAQGATASDLSIVTLSGPSGPIAGGQVSTSNYTVTYTTTSQVSVGTYTVTMMPEDSFGDIASTSTYTFVIPSASPASAGSFTSIVAYPNPVRSSPLNVAFTLGSSGSVDVDIFTILGQRIRHDSGTYGSGTSTYQWYLVNDSNSRVAAGVYIIRMTANSGGQTSVVTKKAMVLP